MLFGQESEFTTFPISSYNVAADSVTAALYTGDTTEKLTATYSLVDALFAIDPTAEIKKNKTGNTFKCIDGSYQTISSTELKRLADENSIF